MTIHLYNTLTRAKQKFIPAHPERVTMYVCGPTVYSHAHIGNARPAVVFDVLYRLLKHEFSTVIYARNITDVDDKINTAALKENTSIDSISTRYAEIYHRDMAQLGVLSPDIEPRVTRHMPQIIAMIERLIASGNAYMVAGHVLFHVPSYTEYGKLSGRNVQDMIAGARVEVAPYKRDPADFVLWKPSNVEQPSWDSPWGQGRPGWHIECSAMAAQHLGETIDIHGGGQDLIFPHHENERAQSTCAHHGKPFSRYWIHNGLVKVNHEKMSKSIGNVLLVHNLLQEAPGEAIRVTLLGAHYRSPLDWTDKALAQSHNNLNRLYGVLQELEDIDINVKALASDVPAAFKEALADDLNTPAAFAELHKLARRVKTVVGVEARRKIRQQLLAAGSLLGILQQQPAAWFHSAREIDRAEIEALIASRTQAKQARNFELADRIRDRLKAMNIALQDRPDGTSGWRKL